MCYRYYSVFRLLLRVKRPFGRSVVRWGSGSAESYDSYKC